MTSGSRQKVADLKEQSEKLMAQAEEHAENGDLTASKKAVEAATKIKEDIEELKEKHTFMSGGEQVCEICGVRCNPDEQADYKAHLDGKLHEAYQKIRDEVKRVRKSVQEGREVRDNEPARDRDRERRDGDR